MPSDPFESEGAPASAPRKASPKWPFVLLGCVLFCAGSGTATVWATYATWSLFVGWGIGTDIDDYEQTISSSDLDAAKKLELLGRLDRLRAALKQDRGWLISWIDYDKRIRDSLGDYVITSSELAALERALLRLEKASGAEPFVPPFTPEAEVDKPR